MLGAPILEAVLYAGKIGYYDYPQRIKKPRSGLTFVLGDIAPGPVVWPF
jgi:hypothetical protein